MQTNFDVNSSFESWKEAEGRQKEWALQALTKDLERFALTICWQRIPEHRSEFDSITSKVIWEAIREGNKFRGDSLFSTWFYKITLNACNKFLRKHKERCETNLEEEMPSASQGVDARIDIVSMLNSLEGQDHLLFRLVAEGEDFKTIGGRLGISRYAAAVRWNRLKGRLRDARSA